MAETKQEKRTFKYGDQEYLLDDLLRLHTQYENNYYNFARDRGSYDDVALQGLRTAITSRINAARAGREFTGDGILDTDKVDNISIATTEKKGLKKKTKYVDQDNTEWAKHYFNKLVGMLKPYEKSKSTGGWDISKHGLSAYLTGQGLTAQDVFENYDLRDENNPDAPRSNAKRRELLKKHLEGYKNWLSSKGFDFTSNDNDWDDNFGTDFDNFVTDFSTDITNYDNNALIASLRKFGAGDYTTAFTSSEYKSPSATDSDTDDSSDSGVNYGETPEEKRAREEAERRLPAYLREYENHAYSKRRTSAENYYSPYDYSKDGKSDFRSWYGDLNQDQQGTYGTYLGIDNGKWANAWQTLMNSFKTGQAYNDKNIGILLQGTYEHRPNEFIDLGNGTFLIEDSVSDDGQGIIYDPRSGYTNTIFLGDVAGKNERIKNIYRNLAYKYINSKYNTNYSDRQYVFKEGGNIAKYQYGNDIIYNWERTEDVYRPKAEENGISVETQMAKDRYIAGRNKSIDNPNAGWKLTSAQTARIGYAALDLTSMISAFAAGPGTAVSAATGVMSTAGNFITDLNDDAVTTGEAFSNLAMNLGLDALGLIPGGGASSKFGKIMKSLKTVVPVIVAMPAVSTLFSNAPEIAESWKKALDGDPKKGGSKLTYQDYMNILQTLNVALGGATIGKNIQFNKKHISTPKDKIAIEVTDKAGKKQALVFEGEDAVNFKQANAEGKAQEFIDKIEGDKEFSIVEVSESNKGKFWGKDDNGKFELFHQYPFGHTNTGKAKIVELKVAPVRDSRGRVIKNTDGTPQTMLYGDRGKIGVNPDYMDADLTNMSSRQSIDQFNKQASEDIKSLREKAKKYAEYHQKAVTLEEKIDKKIATETTNKTAVEKELTDNQKILDDNQSKVQSYEDWINSGGETQSFKNINDLKEQKYLLEMSKVGKPRKEQLIIQKQVDEIDLKIKKELDNINEYGSEEMKKLAEQYKNAELKKSDLEVSVNKINKLLEKYNRRKDFVHTRANTHSDAYNELSNFSRKKFFNGKEYTYTPADGDLDLKDLYKQGGSINRNKINKFLNYAKG